MWIIAADVGFAGKVLLDKDSEWLELFHLRCLQRRMSLDYEIVGVGSIRGEMGAAFLFDMVNHIAVDSDGCGLHLCRLRRFRKDMSCRMLTRDPVPERQLREEEGRSPSSWSDAMIT